MPLSGDDAAWRREKKPGSAKIEAGVNHKGNEYPQGEARVGGRARTLLSSGGRPQQTAGFRENEAAGWERQGPRGLPSPP